MVRQPLAICLGLTLILIKGTPTYAYSQRVFSPSLLFRPLLCVPQPSLQPGAAGTCKPSPACDSACGTMRDIATQQEAVVRARQ